MSLRYLVQWVRQRLREGTVNLGAGWTERETRKADKEGGTGSGGLHFASVGTDVGKGVEDVGQGRCGEVLWMEVAAVNRP